MTTANSSRTELIFIPRASIPHYRVMRTQDKQGVDIYLTETKSHGFESPQTGFPGKDEERHQRRVGFYPSPTCWTQEHAWAFQHPCSRELGRGEPLKAMALGHGQGI